MTIESRETATSNPKMYSVSSSQLELLPGRNGGTGENASRISAILTAGVRWTASASPIEERNDDVH
jgi:hypothetical protein